jgi:hypothetical protein
LDELRYIMKNTFESERAQREEGYIMLGVVILLCLSMLLSMGMLSSSATNARTRHVVRTQADNYYEVEETLNSVVGWLQTHSKSIVTPFMDVNFHNNFDVGAPTVGDNEGQHFEVPTMVKMKGTNNSAMLSTNEFFGQSAFPAAEHLNTGALFDAFNEFVSAELGGANARIILVWARETDGHYEPVFRVDVMTGNNPDRGVHSFSYVYSTLVINNPAVNFYGQNSVTLDSPNNECYSYSFSHDGASWDNGAQRANCGIGSEGLISTSARINGTAHSNVEPGLALNPPAGDVSGSTCEAAGCHGYTLPAVSDWNTYCPGGGVDPVIAVGGSQTLAAGGCFRDANIGNNGVLYLEDTTTPYYFRSINFGPNMAQVQFGPGGVVPVGEKVTLYVESISNDQVNGNMFYNQNNAPGQVEVIYIGADNLTLNGTASLNMFLTSPNADVMVNGNFNYYGGIWARQLDIQGKARLWADESVVGVPVLSDMNFSLKKTSQRYR